MAFQGWLLKVGDTDISKYVDIENYKVSPEQRADLDSDRNGLNKLYREVADHYNNQNRVQYNSYGVCRNDRFSAGSGNCIHKCEGKESISHIL